MSVIVCMAAVLCVLAHAGVAATVQAGSDIQLSIDSASTGDTVLVGPGVYDKFTISKSLNVIGNGAVVVAGGSDACISVEASGVTISGFTVRDGLYGIRLNSVTGCKITNNTVIHCKQPGIALLFSDANTISGNNASFNGLGGEGWYGIYLSNSNDNLIENNIACNNGAYGIDLFPSCNNNTIRGNVLNSNMYGLYMFTDCANNVIEKNVMSENKASGLDMRFNCHHNVVRNNTMEDNIVVGISLLDSGYDEILGNIVSSNGRFGIQIQGGNGSSTVAWNNISGSPTGIYVDSSNNLFHGNRMADNVIQVDDRGSNRWNADYPAGGNSWGDYSGKDEYSGAGQDSIGPDGFGDTPYRISESASDMYPVMGERFVPIKVLRSSISPPSAVVGENVIIQVWIDAVNGVDQVSARVPDTEAAGYILMTYLGDHFQGTLSTALMEPGNYSAVLTVTDERGYQLDETIGMFTLTPRQGRDFEAAMSQLRMPNSQI